MKTLISTSFKRVKKNFKKTVFSSFCVFVSMLLISVFCVAICMLLQFESTIPEFPIGEGGVGAENSVSLNKFISDVIDYMAFALAAVALITFFSIYVYIRQLSWDSESFYATLASVGAAKRQRLIISIIETALLYLLPIVCGAVLGAFIGHYAGVSLIKLLNEDFTPEIPSYLIAAALVFVSTFLVLSFSFLGKIKKKGSLIESLRGHNKKEAEARHSYRKSYTFRNMPIEKRIAKKSVEYYSRPYRRISLSVAGCFMYLVIAVLFYYAFGNVKIIIDNNPSDSLDTAAMAESVIMSILIFSTVSLLILSAVGLCQIVLMVRAQRRLRAESLFIYRSVGLSKRGIKKVLKYEYRTVAFNALLYILIGTLGALTLIV